MRRLCPVCTADMNGRRSNATFCSTRCRKRGGRAAQVVTTPTVHDAPAPTPAQVAKAAPRKPPTARSGLVRAVTTELTSAGVLDTVNGQLAVQLAKQISIAGATGIVTVSKELKSVLAEALAASAGLSGGTAAATTTGAGDDDDEVGRARSVREHKARAAAGRA